MFKAQDKGVPTTTRPIVLTMPVLLFVTLAILAMTPSHAAAEPVQDGVIRDGEYAFDLIESDGDMEIHWQVEGDHVDLGLRARTTGWVAIGLEPTSFMKDADMYFGWASGGNTFTQDAYATGTFGPHPPDTDLGGTYDIDSASAKEAGGWTTFEFRRALDTGDGRDHPVPADGKLHIIWAVGANDDWNNKHIMRGKATIHTGTGEVDVDPGLPRWTFHASLMTTGILLLLYGYIVVRRKERGWMARHRRLNIAGGTLVVLGLLAGIAMVVQSGGPHLRLPHAWSGVVTLAITMATLALGLYYHKAPAARKRAFRRPKIWMGRASLVLLLLTMSLGALSVYLGL